MQSLLESRPRHRWREAPSAPGASGRTVPKGWYETSINDTGLYINGVTFKPGDWGDHGRPIIRIQNLSGINADYNRTTNEFPIDNLVRHGDLLVSWSATLDAYVWRGAEGVLNQHIFKVIPNTAAVTAEFLYWLLKHEIRVLADGQHAHGLAMMHINRGPFLAHPVLLPPLAEQQRIVAKVDELMALCDELETAQAARDRRRDRLTAASLFLLSKPTNRDGSADDGQHLRFCLHHLTRLTAHFDQIPAIRQSILNLAIQGALVAQDNDDEPAAELLQRIALEKGRLGSNGRAKSRLHLPPIEDAEVPFPIPASWAWARLGAIGYTQTGTTPSKQLGEPFGNYIPFVKPGDMYPNSVDYTNEGLSEDGLKASGRVVPEGSLMMVCIGATLGKCQVIDRACSFNQQINSLTPVCGLPSRYLLAVLRSAYFQHAAWASAAQGTLPILNKGKWELLVVPLPPIAEQYRIAAKVDELMAVCDNLERSLAAAQTKRGELLNAVLHEALADAS